MEELSHLQERVLQLFLRLCGYFPIGFLLHCEQGNGTLAGEIDTLAVRFAYHREEGTGNALPQWLNVPSDKIDLLVCEAKTHRRNFNASLCTSENIERVLNRFGIVEKSNDSQYRSIAAQAADYLRDTKKLRISSFPCFNLPSSGAQLRFLLFCGNKAPTVGNRGPYIYADEVLMHIHRCLDPKRAPATCARTYCTDHWWPNQDVVDAMKRFSTCPASLAELHSILTKPT